MVSRINSLKAYPKLHLIFVGLLSQLLREDVGVHKEVSVDPWE